MGSTLSALFHQLINAGLFKGLWANTSISIDGVHLVVIGGSPEEGVKVVDSASGKRFEDCTSFEVKLSAEHNCVGLSSKGLEEDIVEIVLQDTLQLISRPYGTRQHSVYDIPFEQPKQQVTFQLATGTSGLVVRPLGKTLDVWFKERQLAA